jgi:hypothetical protein
VHLGSRRGLRHARDRLAEVSRDDVGQEPMVGVGRRVRLHHGVAEEDQVAPGAVERIDRLEREALDRAPQARRVRQHEPLQAEHAARDHGERDARAPRPAERGPS